MSCNTLRSFKQIMVKYVSNVHLMKSLSCEVEIKVPFEKLCPFFKTTFLKPIWLFSSKFSVTSVHLHQSLLLLKDRWGLCPIYLYYIVCQQLINPIKTTDLLYLIILAIGYLPIERMIRTAVKIFVSLEFSFLDWHWQQHSTTSLKS